MAKSKKHIAKQEDFHRYRNGQMSAREQHDFEKHLLDNEFENEAYAGLSQLSAEEINADLKSLSAIVGSRSKNRNNFNLWKVAATLLLLGIFSFSIYYLMDWNNTTEIAQSKKAMPNEDTVTALSTPEKNEEDGQVIALNREDKKASKNHEKIQLAEQKPAPVISKELIEVPDEEEIEGLNLDLDIQDFDESTAIRQEVESEAPVAENDEEAADLITSKKENEARQTSAPSARKKVASESIESSRNAGHTASFSTQESVENPLMVPRPEGGEEQFDDYILKNLKYPESAIRDGIEGIVELQFAVGIDGKISNIKILKGIRDDLDEEAVRLIKESPAWVPARINDATITKLTNVKIRFQLKE